MLRECRIKRKLDILDAGAGLGVAERTLRGYEANDDAPPDIIDKMADIYQAPQLRYWYLSKHPVGQKIVPPLTPRSVTAAALRVKNPGRSFNEKCIEFLEIADDERITEEEFEPVMKIRNYFADLVERMMEAILTIDAHIEKTTPVAKQKVVVGQ